MRTVKIDPKCISCGLCATIAPDVFEVLPGEISRVKETANLEVDETLINQAIDQCPVQAISWGEEDIVVDDRIVEPALDNAAPFTPTTEEVTGGDEIG